MQYAVISNQEEKRKLVNMKKGSTLIEVMVAMGVTALLLPALLTAFFSSRGGSGQEESRIMAVSQIREMREVVSYVRGVGWEGVESNGVFHPEVSGNSWQLVPGEEQVGEMRREIEISDAYRDATGELSESGTELDPSVKKVRLQVSWGSVIPSYSETEYYLMRFENLSYIETTVEEFELGVHVGTTVTSDDDGEVTLGAGGSGNWCEPELTAAVVDLPKSGVANAISAIEGQVVVGTGENAAGVSFASVEIANTSPPSGVIAGTMDGYKTNVVYVEEGYSYLGTDTNSKEVVIVDTSSVDAEGKYREAGYWDAPGNNSASGIYVQGEIGFVSLDSSLYTFDLSSREGARTTIEGITLSGQVGEVRVVGNYAYVIIRGGVNALEIVEFDNNGGSLSRVGWVELAGQAGRAVVVNESATRAYLAAAHNTGRGELYSVDISSKIGSRVITGQYDTGEMDPEGVAVVTNGKVIIAGDGGEEYQVVTVREVGSGVEMVRCGGLEMDSGVRGVVGLVESDGDAYAYVITRDSASELKIIEGGPGGSLAIEGVYESASFVPGKRVMFNRVEMEENLPSQTQIEYQVALSESVGGSCETATYNFVGPDLTSGSFFSGGSALPLGSQVGYSNPGECMKLKAYLSTTDGTVAPSLLSWTLNYSP